MPIVTPSHSNDNDYRSDGTTNTNTIATTIQTTRMMTVFNNPYFDAIWCHGRTLTDAEWNDLSILNVCVCAVLKGSC
jgi:hypothetical protein